jgi:hypothetical protein
MRLALAVLTLLTLLVHGYHPFAEDGGLYVAGIELTLSPSLFPHYREFVAAHLHLSLFAPFVAALVRLTKLSLAWVLLALDLLSIRLTLGAARRILALCNFDSRTQLAGVGLLAAWWTLPIAGTSLLLMDPYLTARSLSLPLSLYAIAFALHPNPRGRLAALLLLAVAAVFHPLMAAYAAAFLVALVIALTRRPLSLAIVFALVCLTVAALVHALASPTNPAVTAASLSRYYWFLSQWHWFELLGLLAPLTIFGLLSRARGLDDKTSALCRACLITGITAVLVALLFAHAHDTTYLIARLQPLRCFVLIYVMMALLLGATLSQKLFASQTQSLRTLPALFVLASAAGLFFAQRATFPVSPHLELPGRANSNPWVQAFLWSRAHTPGDALFALDARYINQDGEDAQTFRAWSQRSALPDFSKDGGEASITPSLAPTWQRAAAAQQDLATLTDADRDARLRPFGVTWILLPITTSTNRLCPYQNAVVKVCRLTLATH